MLNVHEKYCSIVFRTLSEGGRVGLANKTSVREKNNKEIIHFLHSLTVQVN